MREEMRNQKKEFPYLLKTYPKLQKIPWVSLINYPTPVEKLEGMEKEVGFQKEIFQIRRIYVALVLISTFFINLKLFKTLKF